MLVFLAVLLSLGVAALIARPLFMKGPSAAADPSIALYKDQLAEIDRDSDRGLLSEKEADAARIEVQRRLLAASRRQDTGSAVSRVGRLAGVAAIAIAPLFAMLAIGPLSGPQQVAGTPPEPPGAPPADPRMDARIVELEERLASAPEDIDATLELARRLAVIEEFDAALETYRRANALTGGRSSLIQGEYAEALVAQARGRVPPEAQAIFTMLSEADPSDIRSQYFLAMAERQAGEEEAARQRLARVLASAEGPDEPWIEAVRGFAAALDQADQ